MSRSFTWAICMVISGVSVLLLASCNQEQEQPADSLSTTNIQLISDNSAVGTSNLARGNKYVSATIHTSGLEPQAAYTAWWVVFNNPENCSDGLCGLDDFAVPEVEASQIWLAGNIANRKGEATFAGHLAIEDTSKADFGPGLLDTAKAEIYLVVRTHGQLIPDMAHEQLSTFDGGCPPNACANVQLAIHLP